MTGMWRARGGHVEGTWVIVIDRSSTCPDGADALASELLHPFHLAVNAKGEVFFIEPEMHRVF